MVIPLFKEREYSMAKKERKDLKTRMEQLQIKEEDLEEKFIQGSGSGGQKINKTSSCVYLKHPQSGIQVKCQKTRSLSHNRTLAREQLCSLLEKRNKAQKANERALFEKKRRSKRKRSKKGQEKVLKAKKLHSVKKRLRKAAEE